MLGFFLGFVGKVEKDISVIGFDGLEYATYFEPSISTISQPNVTFAEKSTEILFELIEEGAEQKHLVLATELLKRESCKSIK